jgi:hypothetical protein
MHRHAVWQRRSGGKFGAVGSTPGSSTATGWTLRPAARIRMFDRVIASASLALSNLPVNNDRHAMLRATIDSMAEDTAADLMPQPDPSRE